MIGSEGRENAVSAAASGSLLLAAPTALAGLLVAGTAWREGGSILAGDWLPYALLLALLVAVVLAAGVAGLPDRAALVALAGLGGLAVWTALSASWSPLPASARDEALLMATYVFALALPLVTLRGPAAREAATAALVAVAGGLAVAAAVTLAWGSAPEDRFDFGRLSFPIDYVNAQGAAALLAFWPAAALAARRGSPVVVRALAGGAATAMLAMELLVQSKGGAVGLAAASVVVLAVSPARLRLLVPALGTLALVAISFRTLNEPFQRRDSDSALADAARVAGGRVLVLTVVGIALAAAWALLDERMTLSERAHRLAGRIAAAALVVAVVAGLAAFVVRVDHPVGWANERWHDFKTLPQTETASSHLLSLGSNRYDFWRVALDEFRDHPLAGIGARGWDVAYLQHGRSAETPRRSHSLELDVASEEGIVGLALLGIALAPLGIVLVRRARRDVVAAGLLGAGAYFVVHSAADWIWTFPAVGILIFLRVGTGASPDDPPGLPGRAAYPLAGVAAAVALLAFAPVWTSARITADELDNPGSDPHADLAWARRLDPLSTEPLLAEAELAARPADAIPPLRKAADREPHSAAVRYQLGVALQRAGRDAEARTELEAAKRLSPRDPVIAEALRQAGG